MNTKTLANHYSQLTPEERFRLIMAAADRGDETEQQRLRDTGQRLTLSMPAHAPYAHAFQEVLLMTYLELLEDAALYHEHHELAAKERLASIEAAKASKRMKAPTPRTKDQAPKEDAVEFPTWHRYGRIAYGVGYLFKMKIAGWKLFCAPLNVSPLPCGNKWTFLDWIG